MNNQELINKIDLLDENDLTFVCGRLAEYLNEDKPPVISEADIENLSTENKEFLDNINADLNLEQENLMPKKEALRILLQTVLIEYPEHEQIIGEAVEELKREDLKLDFGLSIALAIVVPAIAVAIIRPQLKYAAKKDGKKSEKNFELKVNGVPGIENLLKAVLPFLK